MNKCPIDNGRIASACFYFVATKSGGRWFEPLSIHILDIYGLNDRRRR